MATSQSDLLECGVVVTLAAAAAVRGAVTRVVLGAAVVVALAVSGRIGRAAAGTELISTGVAWIVIEVLRGAALTRAAVTFVVDVVAVARGGLDDELAATTTEAAAAWW
jgi:hypothetical protein